MSISKICRITKVILCGIALLVVSTSCQPDGDKCGKDEEVAVVFQKGCVVWLEGIRYKLSDHIYGAHENEGEMRRIECRLRQYDSERTRFFIVADPDMTHMEFHTCMMSFQREPFAMFFRNAAGQEIKISPLPLEASYEYMLVDNKPGAYLSFILDEKRLYSKWEPKCQVFVNSGFKNGVAQIIPSCSEGNQCAYVDVRCLVTIKIGPLLDVIDVSAQKGYTSIFLGLLWGPDWFLPR